MSTRLSSIESKLTLYVLFFSILLGVLFSAVQIGVDYLGENRRFFANTTELLERQSAPAALSLYNYDASAMQTILDSLLLNRAIVASAIVEDATGFEKRAGLSKIQLADAAESFYYRMQNVVLTEPSIYTSKPRAIGQLEVWTDLRLTREGFERRAAITLLLDVLRNVALAFVLILVFRSRLTGPVKRLIDRLMEIDPRNPQKTSLVVEAALRHSELDDLVSKMNTLLLAMKNEIYSRHQAEGRIRQLNEQLEEKVRARTKALNDSNSQLQHSIDELRRTQDLLLQAQRMASMGHLAAGMAHEINNPIAVVYSNIATLSEYLSELIRLADQYQAAEEHIADKTVVAALEDLRDKIDLDFVRDDAPDLVRTSRQSLERVRKIVSELRTFADSEHLEKETIVLDDLMQDAIAELRLLDEPAINVYRYLQQLPAVHCIPQQVRLVFRNILHNARDAMPDGGTIEIAGDSDGSVVSVMVKDSGMGMNSEDLACAVNPFFTRKEIGQGTGLGLTVAYNIMVNHGGELLIDSQPGKGTVVTLRFPI
ncbi:sensor histidine kinase [Thalassolituus sp. LLYu03]|uniref:sensor histidine kinase n=1 Tax=Thalassolituus sp. LLYu03 TaxID=3421656 RepID=UPI003D2DA1A8